MGGIKGAEGNATATLGKSPEAAASGCHGRLLQATSATRFARVVTQSYWAHVGSFMAVGTDHEPSIQP